MRQALAEFRSGLALGTRALLAKELRSRSRGWRPLLLLSFYLGMLTLGVAGFLALLTSAGGTLNPAIGTLLFSTLATGAVLLLAFITPALTTGAISGERERRTLELLMVTRASALGLVSGKLLGSLFYILFLLAASLPAFAVVYLFGGVPPLYLAMVLAVAAITALGHAALGLLLSALLKRTIVASVVAYLIVFVLVFGVPFVAAVSAVAFRGQALSSPAAYVYASPLVSLGSVLPSSAEGLGLPIVGDLPRVILGGSPGVGAVARPATLPLTQVTYVVSIDPRTGQTETAVGWAPWVYHFAFCGALTALCLGWASLAVTTVKPWTAWRVRRRPAPALSDRPRGEPA